MQFQRIMSNENDDVIKWYFYVNNVFMQYFLCTLRYTKFTTKCLCFFLPEVVSCSYTITLDRILGID